MNPYMLSLANVLSVAIMKPRPRKPGMNLNRGNYPQEKGIIMAAKKYATVEQIQGLEAQMKNIMAALATLAEKPEAPKAAKPVEHKANVPIIGKPSKVYVERDWVWCQWNQKPTEKTLQRLKAAGWAWSKKRQAWHKVNA